MSVDEVLYRLSECFDALSNALRLKTLKLLLERKYFVKELAGELERSQQTVSRHLKLLRKQGLVVSETEGPRRYYWVKKPELVREALRMRRFFERQETDQGN